MKRPETILIFVLLSLGSISIISWLVTKNMIFNTVGIGLIGGGVGLYLGLRSLK